MSENWNQILSEYKEYLGQEFTRDGETYVLDGVMHGVEDYYYVMVKAEDSWSAEFFSCVGSLEGWGFTRTGVVYGGPLARGLSIKD